MNSKRAINDLDETEFQEFLYKLKNSSLYKAKELIEHEIDMSERAINEGWEERK